MKPEFLLLAFSLLALSVSNADEVQRNEEQQRHERWMNAGDTWYTRWMNLADQSPQMQPEERIALLGGALGIVAPYKEVTPEQTEVFLRVQRIILATPGHAEYFGKKITDTHRQYRSSPHAFEHGGGSKYVDALHRGWATLKHLPSPETVRVVGEMLSDEWVDETNNDGYRPPSLARAGASVLSELPLRDKPYPFLKTLNKEQVDASLPHWQQWYQQVKEGQRTFSFEGDPNEYNLDGPVGLAKISDIPRVEERPPASKPQPPLVETDSPPPPSRTPWIIAAIAALSTAIGWFFLKKKQAS